MATPIVIDFTNTKDSSGINPTHQPAGDYRGKIMKCDVGPSQAGNPQVVYLIQDADRPSAVYRYNCPLSEKSLWKIRNILVAAGVSVPKKKVKIDPERIVGKEVGMSLDDDEYEGKMRSQIVGVFPASDLAEDSDDTATDEDVAEEAPAAKKKAAAKKTKPASTPAADDEDDDEELDELDIDEL